MRLGARSCRVCLADGQPGRYDSRGRWGQVVGSPQHFEEGGGGGSVEGRVVDIASFGVNRPREALLGEAELGVDARLVAPGIESVPIAVEEHRVQAVQLKAGAVVVKALVAQAGRNAAGSGEGDGEAGHSARG